MRAIRLTARLIAARLIGTVTHVSTDERVAALTFDDGPHPEFTPRLLDILEEHQARATFFCLGKFAQRHPDILRRMAEARHAIGNHSWDHPSFPLIGSSERRRQLRACAEALAPHGQPLFRPPWGNQSYASRLDALWLGYQVVTWNVLAEDWLDHDADWLAQRVLGKLGPGSIIVFHDRLATAQNPRYFDRGPTLEAVEKLLTKLRGDYRFVTVPELLRVGRAHRENWRQSHAAEWLNARITEEGLAHRHALPR